MRIGVAPTNLSRQHGRATTHPDIDGDTVEILSTERSTKYLGRKLTLRDYHCIELSNRIAVGWWRVPPAPNELTNKRCPLHSRLRLFNGTVAPRV
eukprot:2065209-Pyramimonas_sp.AAC.1